MSEKGRFTEDEYLMISGIQHFVFCRRQWALIHIEKQWEENFRTMDGAIMHKHAHDSSFREKRGNLIITRSMPVSSPSLGLSGECDVVEFKKSAEGISIAGEEGKYQVVPVEYKRGSPKQNLSDTLQLAAQAMCLEDMLCCRITEGYLYYGETRHRLRIEIDDTLREKLKTVVDEMHDLFSRGYTPKAKRSKSCNACSLKNICLPQMDKKKSVSAYIANRLSEVTDDEKTS